MADGGTGFGGPRRKPCLLLSVFLACSLWHMKPRPPVNLTLKMAKRGYILTWEDDYNEKHILHKNPETDYEVAYGQEGVKARQRMTPDMQLKIQTYMPARTYVAKVRQKNFYLGNIWSDWSIPISWRTPGRGG